MYSQSAFDKGYRDGHKKGYCNASAQNGDMYCNYPNTYVNVPLTKIGEDNSSYRDGYNRGLYDGQSAYSNKGNNAIERKPYQYRDPEPLTIAPLGNAASALQGRYDNNITLIQNKVNQVQKTINSVYEQFGGSWNNQQQKDYVVSYYQYVNNHINRTALDYSRSNITNAMLNYFSTVQSEVKSWLNNPNKEPQSLDTSYWDSLGYTPSYSNSNTIKIGAEEIGYKFSLGVGIGFVGSFFTIRKHLKV